MTRGDMDLHKNSVPTRRRELYMLVAILLVAALLRLVNLGSADELSESGRFRSSHSQNQTLGEVMQARNQAAGLRRGFIGCPFNAPSAGYTSKRLPSVAESIAGGVDHVEPGL